MCRLVPPEPGEGGSARTGFALSRSDLDPRSERPADGSTFEAALGTPPSHVLSWFSAHGEVARSWRGMIARTTPATNMPAGMASGQCSRVEETVAPVASVCLLLLVTSRTSAKASKTRTPGADAASTTPTILRVNRCMICGAAISTTKATHSRESAVRK
jgi:hypothetical protein